MEPGPLGLSFVEFFSPFPLLHWPLVGLIPSPSVLCKSCQGLMTSPVDVQAPALSSILLGCLPVRFLLTHPRQ